MMLKLTVHRLEGFADAAYSYEFLETNGLFVAEYSDSHVLIVCSGYNDDGTPFTHGFTVEKLEFAKLLESGTAFLMRRNE